LAGIRRHPDELAQAIKPIMRLRCAPVKYSTTSRARSIDRDSFSFASVRYTVRLARLTLRQNGVVPKRNRRVVSPARFE